MRAICIILFFSFHCLYGQVGINTIDPQQELHLGSTTGSLRIESLNNSNNSFNGGDIENDGDLTNNTFPLYVDENGNFTLELKTHTNTEETDALNDTSLPTSAVSLLTTDADGKVTTVIKTYTITVNRVSLVEVKYNLSFDIYLNSLKAKIADNLARRLSTYLTVTGQTRQYGPASKCYSSGSINSVYGTLYNASTAYITLPAAGTYDISLIGEVSSDLRSGGGPGGPTKATYVEFATGNDFMFIRLH